MQFPYGNEEIVTIEFFFSCLHSFHNLINVDHLQLPGDGFHIRLDHRILSFIEELAILRQHLPTPFIKSNQIFSFFGSLQQFRIDIRRIRLNALFLHLRDDLVYIGHIFRF